MRTPDGARAGFADSAARRARGLAQRVSLACLLLPLLTACADGFLAPPSSLKMDPATLAQIKRNSERMIIVTVANPGQSMPLLAGTTSGSYNGTPLYVASGSARATVAAIARDYRLREVAAWPIVPLQVHCAVLEVSGNRTREQVLSALVLDKRVKLAQPLQTFHALGTPATGLDKANDHPFG